MIAALKYDAEVLNITKQAPASTSLTKRRMHYSKYLLLLSGSDTKCDRRITTNLIEIDLDGVFLHSSDQIERKSRPTFVHVYCPL